MHTVLDPVSAPVDYDDLHRQYFDFTVRLVSRLGIRDAEDVAQAILMRFWERDFLQEFNPDLTFDVRGKQVTAKFKSFLSAFIERYCRHYRERQGIHDTREPLRCDMEVGEGGTLWVELHAPPSTDADTWALVEEADLVDRIRAYLLTLPVRGKRDLPRLFDLVVRDARTIGIPDRAAIARDFGVSSTAISSMFGDLRNAVAECLLLDWPRQP